MAEIYLFPKNAEEHEAERHWPRPCTPSMRPLSTLRNVGLKLNWAGSMVVHHTHSTWWLVFRRGTCSQNFSRSEERFQRRSCALAAHLAWRFSTAALGMYCACQACGAC